MGDRTIDSTRHLVLSLVVAGGAIATTAPPNPAVVVLVAVAAGVGIDVDHFPLARYRDGDWRVLRALAANPTAPLTDPAPLFADSDFDALDRLLSHVVIAGVVVPALAAVSTSLALVAAASLYVHLLADLVQTRRTVVVGRPDR